MILLIPSIVYFLKCSRKHNISLLNSEYRLYVQHYELPIFLEVQRKKFSHDTILKLMKGRH